MTANTYMQSLSLQFSILQAMVIEEKDSPGPRLTSTYLDLIRPYLLGKRKRRNISTSNEYHTPAYQNIARGTVVQLPGHSSEK